MNRIRTTDIAGAIVIVALVIFLIYTCNNTCNDKNVAVSVAKQETVAAKQPVSVPDMKVGTLFVNEVVAKKSTTELNEVKKSEVDKQHVKKSKVDEQYVKNQHVEKSEVDKMHVKKAEVDDMHIKRAEVDDMHIKRAEVDKMTVKEAEINFVKKTKSATLKCDSKDCWPRNPKGNYFPLGKFGDAMLIGNINNPRYPKDSISAKMEYHSGVWGPRVIVRNVTTSPESLLTPRLRQEITDHLAKIGPYKIGQPGKEDGESCFEKTWIVNPKTGTWSIRK